MRKESTITTRLMRGGFISMFAFCGALFTSCSSDSDFSDSTNDKVITEFAVDAHSKNAANFGTRSSLYFTSKGMDFKWTDDDELTVFAKGNYSNRMTYSLQGGAGGTNATFHSNNFELTADGTMYFALSKSEAKAGGHTNIPDLRNISLDYSGQKQVGNADYNHLGAYDYMAAATHCTANDQAHFSFTHLGATLRIWMWPESDADYEDFRGTEFTKLEIYDSENSFKQPLRNFSFEAGLNGDEYSPVWPAQSIAADAPRFTMNLQSKTDPEKGIKPTDAFDDGSFTNNDASGNLLLYIEVPPVDLRGKTLGFIITGKKDGETKTYYCTTPGFNIQADNAYQCNLKLKKPTEYKVTLKINHLWQNGAEPTRATGDPGNDKEFGLPAHVYYIFCVDGNVRNVKHLGSPSASELAVNHFTTSTTEGDDWTTEKSADKCVSTLKNTELVLSVKSGEENSEKHLYVVASKRPLTLSVADDASEEEVVQALTYDIQIPETGTAAEKQEASQIFMRDLYSTPYKSGYSFVGDITDPVQDIFLYHVAAKVDLKWNSATRMDIEGANSLIKVTDVNNTGLYLFKPAENNNTTGSYTVTTPITKGTYYNGRQVYYLPQFSDYKYNITIGPKIYDGTGGNQPKYNFTNTTSQGGFTSWFRASIVQ